MKVREIMTADVGCCGPRTSAAAIAEICWNKSCGAVPVVDETNKVLGMVTDRDLFIALGTRNGRASELAAADVMSKDVALCSPDDDVKQALNVMTARKVRRLPVVDRERTLKGILSLHDIVRWAGKSDVSQTAIVNLLAKLCEHGAAAAPKPAATAAAAR